jgi:hypothetical protein
MNEQANNNTESKIKKKQINLSNAHNLISSHIKKKSINKSKNLKIGGRQK